MLSSFLIASFEREILSALLSGYILATNSAYNIFLYPTTLSMIDEVE
jgi:hypothetical protein